MINARAESLTEKPGFKHLVAVAAVSSPLTDSMSGGKRGSVKSQCGFI
jgi:hypothetical protein